MTKWVLNRSSLGPLGWLVVALLTLVGCSKSPVDQAKAVPAKPSTTQVASRKGNAQSSPSVKSTKSPSRFEMPTRRGSSGSSKTVKAGSTPQQESSSGQATGAGRDSLWRPQSSRDTPRRSQPSEDQSKKAIATGSNGEAAKSSASGKPWRVDAESRKEASVRQTNETLVEDSVPVQQEDALGNDWKQFGAAELTGRENEGNVAKTTLGNEPNANFDETAEDLADSSWAAGFLSNEGTEFAEEDRDVDTATDSVENAVSNEFRDLLRIEPTEEEATQLFESEEKVAVDSGLEASDFETAKGAAEGTALLSSQSTLPDVEETTTSPLSEHLIDRAQDSAAEVRQQVTDLAQGSALSKFSANRKPSVSTAIKKLHRPESLAKSQEATQVATKPLATPARDWSANRGPKTRASSENRVAPATKQARPQSPVVAAIPSERQPTGQLRANVAKQEKNKPPRRLSQSADTKSLSVGVIADRSYQSPQEGSGVVFTDRVRIRNSSRIGLPVSFAYGKQIKKLYPGELFEIPLSPRGGIDIQFHNGGSLGVGAKRLSVGTYEFHVTAKGWQLRRVQ